MNTLRMIWKLLRRVDDRIARMTLRLPKRLQGLELRDDLELTLAIARRIYVYGVLALSVGFVLYVAYWLFFTGPRTRLSDPVLQTAIPTAIGSPTPRVIVDLWSGHEWLSAADARNLRGQENVINLAFLEDGSAKYSASYSVVYSGEAPWEKAGKPIGVSELSVEVTSVTLTANGQQYTLNVWQPFVLSQNPTQVFVVDATGQLWRAPLAALTLQPLAEVVESLPTMIAPNQNLSFTY